MHTYYIIYNGKRTRETFKATNHTGGLEALANIRSQRGLAEMEAASVKGSRLYVNSDGSAMALDSSGREILSINVPNFKR